MSRNMALHVCTGLVAALCWVGPARADDGSSHPASKGRWVASQTIQMNAPSEVAFRYTGDLQKWQLWTTWNKEKDPKCAWEYAGEPGKVGHEMRWDGPELGKGRLVLTRIEGDSLWFDLYFGNSKKANHGSITAEGAPLTVTWQAEGRLGFLGGLFKKKIEAGVNKDFQDGLGRLKPLVEHEAAMDAWHAQVAALEAKVSSLHAQAEAARKSAEAQTEEARDAVKAAADAASSKKAADRKVASGLAALAEAKKGMAERASQEAAVKADRLKAAQAELDALKAAPPQS